MKSVPQSSFRASRKQYISQICASIISSLCIVTGAFADGPQVEPLLGGTPRPELPKTQVAFIEGLTSSCSGILVGPRTILTASHCVEEFTPSWAYRIHVAGQVLLPIAGYYNALFDPKGLISVENNRNDLAVFQFLLPVFNLEPVPVLFDAPLKVGDKVSVFGYGTNENFSNYNNANSFIYRARQAEVNLDGVEGGLINYSLARTGISECPGDSGGPTLKLLNGQPVVVAISSFVTDLVQANPCVMGEDSYSVNVDLQSSYSVAFLKQISDIWFASPKLISLRSKSQQLVTNLDKISKLRNYFRVKERLAPYPARAAELIPLAGQKQRSLVSFIKSDIRRASKARTRVATFFLVRRAVGNLWHLVGHVYSSE